MIRPRVTTVFLYASSFQLQLCSFLKIRFRFYFFPSSFFFCSPLCPRCDTRRPSTFGLKIARNLTKKKRERKHTGAQMGNAPVTKGESREHSEYSSEPEQDSLDSSAGTTPTSTLVLPGRGGVGGGGGNVITRTSISSVGPPVRFSFAYLFPKIAHITRKECIVDGE